MFSENAASRNNVWCASSNNVTNFANVNNNGNPNNNNASNANAAAPGFCLTGLSYLRDESVQVSVSRKENSDRKERATERVMPLNLRGDADVRTLLAWLKDCVQLQFHARGLCG